MCVCEGVLCVSLGLTDAMASVGSSPAPLDLSHMTAVCFHLGTVVTLLVSQGVVVSLFAS